MSFAYSNNKLLLLDRKTKGCKASNDGGPHQRSTTGGVQSVDLKSRGQIERIKDMFKTVELSVSSYDTAWVAMVPLRESPNHQPKPCFPESLDWVMKNQHPDGSWCLHSNHPLLVKDSLSSTLACVLALQKWQVGELLVKRGLDYIGSNSWAADDKDQYSPIGFEIVFPGMIDYAKELGLNLPLNPVSMKMMLRKRDLEVGSPSKGCFEGKRSTRIMFRASKSCFEGNRSHLAYVAEGLGKSYDWKEVMKHQRSNGSLFNSPSTTAAALIHLYDDKCFNYLHSLLKIYECAVPTVYPLDIYSRLSMVDNLEKLGIAQYFRNEIESVLDETYRRWMQRDEEIVLDVTCCCMAFRLLRMNGYEISSDALAQFDDEEQFFNSGSKQFTNTNTILELYRASEITIFPEDTILKKVNAWTKSFLKQHLLNQEIHEHQLHEKVEHALKYPYNGVERLENMLNIKQYSEDNFRVLKTCYRCTNINNRDFLELSEEDFSICQAKYQEELKILERWIKDIKLDNMKFARQTLSAAYFSIAVTLFSPELSDARISWTKISILTTIVDDLFDAGGSTEELLNLIELIEKWDGDSSSIYCSEQVEMVFSALYNIINEIAAKASMEQGRCVKHHLIKMWLTLVKCMMREFEWGRDESTPTFDEYILNGYVTTALGPIVLTTLYFLGSELSEEVVESAEYSSLHKHVSIIARLYNDIQSVERESGQGKLINSLSLYVIQNHGEITKEEALKKLREIIESNRRELLKIVLRTEGSMVPKACKDLFWKTTKILDYYFMTRDEYTSPQKILDDMKAVVHEKLNLPHYTS